MTFKTVEDLIISSAVGENTVEAYKKLKVNPRAAASERGLINWVTYVLFNCPAIKSRFCKGKDKHLAIKVRDLQGLDIAVIHLPLRKTVHKKGSFGFMDVNPTFVEFANGETLNNIKGENPHQKVIEKIFTCALSNKELADKSLKNWVMPSDEELNKAFALAYDKALPSHHQLTDIAGNCLRVFDAMLQKATQTDIGIPLTIYIYRDPVTARMDGLSKPEKYEWSYAVTKRVDNKEVRVTSCRGLSEDAVLDSAKFQCENEWMDKNGKLNRHFVEQVIYDYPSADVLKSIQRSRYETHFLNTDTVVDYLESMADRLDKGFDGRGFDGSPLCLPFDFTNYSDPIRKGARALRECIKPRFMPIQPRQ